MTKTDALQFVEFTNYLAALYITKRITWEEFYKYHAQLTLRGGYTYGRRKR